MVAEDTESVGVSAQSGEDPAGLKRRGRQLTRGPEPLAKGARYRDDVRAGLDKGQRQAGEGPGGI